MVKQVKTHLSITYYMRQITQYFCRVSACHMPSRYIYSKKGYSCTEVLSSPIDMTEAGRKEELLQPFFPYRVED